MTTQKSQKDNLTVPRFLAILCVALLMLSSANTRAETNFCNAGIGGTGIQQDGIGGTGAKEEGIGGTGIQANSGVGGTGKQASSGVGGTGIVGIITGFASICVNGLEVFYDKHTEVDIDGMTSNIDALNIGQLVAIESSSNSNHLIAQRLSVSHVIIGKIEKVDSTQNTLQIMGRTIQISPETIVNADLKPQQLVKISGLVATNNQVYTSRIDIARPDTPSQVAGLIDQVGNINGINITSTNKIQAGSMVRVSGSWNGRSLQANEIKESAIQHVLASAKIVIIQDLAPNTTEHLIKLQNQSINIDKHTKISGNNASQNQTIIVYGHPDRAGKINARSIEYTNKNKILERGGKHRTDTSNKLDSDGAKEIKVRLDKPETIERYETVERPEQVDRPEKIERPAKIERPEILERPEKIERPERHEAINH
jgi:Domain of unknown function (DUF5666)